MSKECCGPPAAADEIESADHFADRREAMTPWWRDRSLALPAASGTLVAVGSLLQWNGADQAALVLLWGALVAGAWTFVPGALRHLARGFLGVGLLMTIAAMGAVALGHIGEAAALAFLFSIAEALEDRAMDKAKHGLGSLLSLMPSTTRVVRDGQDVTIEAKDVQIGDVLIIGAGERVATDGVVTTGRSMVDASAITGESIPLEVGPGTEVLAGSVNGGGSLTLQASAAGTDNSLTTIVRLVQEAHRRKGDRARLADRIARPLVPVVLVTAALVAVVGSWLGESSVWIERALVVLVAASPCAMAIAVPVTVISAIGSASKLGVIIKSGEAFEQFGTIRQVAFDKTGTLTRNEPQVVTVLTTADTTDAEVLRVAAALERTSTHPLASAIVDAGGRTLTATDVEELPGHGITGTIDGIDHAVGHHRWLSPGTLSSATDALTDDGMSVVVVHRDGQVLGVIGVRDELKPEAAEAVADLAAAGITAVMISGDNTRTARAIARAAGIETVYAEQLPQDKADLVETMRRQAPTAMVGDGINDAPALAAATVGIAMGATGSAAAVESADIAFTGHDLRQIPAAIAHARRGRRIMTGNILLALAIIVVLFPLALFGVLGLAGVVLVHEVAEVVVIGNGLRAARLRGLRREEAPPVVATTGSGCTDVCCTPNTASPILTIASASRDEATR